MSLGFGIGFRPPHYREILEGRPARIDWYEVISENFTGLGGRPRRVLERLREASPVVLHGVSLSIASPEPVRADYLRGLRALVDWLDPALVSDHLCWTRLGAHNSHDLLPVPLTRAMLAHVAEKVSRVQDALNRRLLLENASAYVAFAGNEMDEAEFLGELCRRTGCGALLDLNNLVVNAHNLRQDPARYFETLRAGDVGQFHLGGHSVQGGIRVDTHDAPVPDEAWDLYRRAITRWPDAPTLIEWDADLPPLARLVAECARAREIAAEARVEPVSSEPCESAVADTRAVGPAEPIDPGAHRALLAVITAEPRTAEAALRALDDARPVRARDGAIVYRSGYVHRLRDSLRETFPALAFVCGEGGFAWLVDAYLARHAPAGDSIKHAGARLAEFLRREPVDFDFGAPLDVLADLAALEWAMAEVFDAAEVASSEPADRTALEALPREAWVSARIGCRTEVLRLLECGYDVAAVQAAVSRGETPALPAAGDYRYVVYRLGEEPHREAVTRETALAVDALRDHGSLGEAACGLVARGAVAELADAVNAAVGALRFLLDRGLVRAIDGGAATTERDSVAFANQVAVPAGNLHHEVPRTVGHALAREP